GVLKLQSRYGPSLCSPASRGLCHQAPISAVTRPYGSLAIQVYRHLLGVILSLTGGLRHWGARSFRYDSLRRQVEYRARTDVCHYDGPRCQNPVVNLFHKLGNENVLLIEAASRTRRSLRFRVTAAI